eukprot:CAMPEP_0206045966 /NCGR_PEP_ID=MMETSP1466-20131121/17373_1 /ASSEMBLY_ACC=CAM_ASM_001126 /TAXON_ID=44452 /ORGANISM="Pavlova gyrans, Strain CCMP608" /LENGTH=135 /DNA_ID=CAMNT_0053420927 /DNA_START=438 /DNA_END=845 /DNA_ORIENTATION=-
MGTTIGTEYRDLSNPTASQTSGIDAKPSMGHVCIPFAAAASMKVWATMPTCLNAHASGVVHCFRNTGSACLMKSGVEGVRSFSGSRSAAKTTLTGAVSTLTLLPSIIAPDSFFFASSDRTTIATHGCVLKEVGAR